MENFKKNNFFGALNETYNEQFMKIEEKIKGKIEW